MFLIKEGDFYNFNSLVDGIIKDKVIFYVGHSQLLLLLSN